MTHLILLTIIFVFSLLESTVLSFLVVPLFVIAIALIYEAQPAQILIFATGIIYDLILIYTFGSSSLIFLIIFFIIFAYERKFSQKNLIYLFVFSLVSTAAYSFLRGLSFSLLTIITNSLMIFLVYPLVLFINELHKNRKSARLKI